MILGLGSDLIDIRRIERAIERFGDRFLHRISPRPSAGSAIDDPIARRVTPGALLRKRLVRRRLAPASTASSGAIWVSLTSLPVNLHAPYRGALRRLDEITPADMAARLDITFTDEPPIAQAVVIITAVPRSRLTYQPRGTFSIRPAFLTSDGGLGLIPRRSSPQGTS